MLSKLRLRSVAAKIELAFALILLLLAVSLGASAFTLLKVMHGVGPASQAYGNRLESAAVRPRALSRAADARPRHRGRRHVDDAARRRAAARRARPAGRPPVGARGRRHPAPGAA